MLGKSWKFGTVAGFNILSFGLLTGNGMDAGNALVLAFSLSLVLIMLWWSTANKRRAISRLINGKIHRLGLTIANDPGSSPVDAQILKFEAYWQITEMISHYSLRFVKYDNASQTTIFGLDNFGLLAISPDGLRVNSNVMADKWSKKPLPIERVDKFLAATVPTISGMIAAMKAKYQSQKQPNNGNNQNQNHSQGQSQNNGQKLTKAQRKAQNRQNNQNGSNQP